MPNNNNNSDKLIKCAVYTIAINQSINEEFVGRRYTPAESVKSTIKKYILELFSKSVISVIS